MRRFAALLALASLALGPAQAEAPRHNVLLFVAGGLRPGVVDPLATPAIAGMLRHGVRFTNMHAAFPTGAMPNAAALATGHLPGDTGIFADTEDVGFPMPGADGSRTPLLENNAALADVNKHFGANLLTEASIMAAARQAGLSTAAIGQAGAVLAFDLAAGDGQSTMIVDDRTGRSGGVPLSASLQQRVEAAKIVPMAPKRGTDAGDTAQQDWFVQIATDAVLPALKERGAPFLLVFWLPDPDSTQAIQTDSLGRLLPGINGVSSRAATRNVDHALATLQAALTAQGLDQSTDLIVLSDHGSSTVTMESATSFAAAQSFPDVPHGSLPPGFVAIDIAHSLQMSLLDPDAGYAPVPQGRYPLRGNALIGGGRDHPKVVVAANGGADLIYVADPTLALQVVSLLAGQDYTSGLFVADALGPVPGTLPLSAIGLTGTAKTPQPTIVVNFRSFTTGCNNPLTCGVEVADSARRQGQGSAGSFSRADTASLAAAIGPDFRTGFVDTAPVSTADWGCTVAHILGLTTAQQGNLAGRVLTEAMPGGAMPSVTRAAQAGPPDGAGRVTMIGIQTVLNERYVEAGGFLGRTLGLAWP